MVVDETLYNTLGVKASSSTSRSKIRKAYHKLAKEFHPDKNAEHGEKFKEISFAYKILSHASMRRDYDDCGLDGNKVATMVPEYALKGFQRVKYLGAGFFGTVSLFRPPAKAAYAKKHKKVVIKEVVNSEGNASAMSEVKLLKGANHWGIVEFLAHFLNEEGNVCIVLEYCDKGTLPEFVGDRPKLEFNIWRFLSHMASALQYLHGKGIQHQDIKPENILGTSSPPEKGLPLGGVICKIADFGVANLLNTHAQQFYFAQSCARSEVYMAPEVVTASESCLSTTGLSKGAEYTPAADIWSVGALVSYFASNGLHLFSSAQEVRQWVAKRSDLRSQTYRVELRRLHATMLNPDPVFRPTAAALVAECHRGKRMQPPAGYCPVNRGFFCPFRNAGGGASSFSTVGLFDISVGWVGGSETSGRGNEDIF